MQQKCILHVFSLLNSPRRPRPPQVNVYQSHLFRHTRVGRAPLDKGSACRIDIYLTT
jgi:hypothetical protein